MPPQENDASPDGRNPGRRPQLARLAPLAVLLALALLVYVMGWHRLLSLQTLVARRNDLDAFVTDNFAASILAYVAVYAAAVAVSLPGAVWLTIAGGVLFGWLAGGLAAALGATAGATLIFLLVRYALQDFVRRRLGPRLAAVTAGFRTDAFNYLLFLRLVPLFPFFLVNLAPALVGVRVGTFVAATAIGILPGTFAFAFFGAGLDSALAGQQAAYRDCQSAGRPDCSIKFDIAAALTPQLIAALCALGIAALIPVAVKRWRARRTPKT